MIISTVLMLHALYIATTVLEVCILQLLCLKCVYYVSDAHYVSIVVFFIDIGFGFFTALSDTYLFM